MGKKSTRAAGFWWYAIAVVFTNVRQLGVVHRRHHLFDDGLGTNCLYWSSGRPELLDQVDRSGRPSCWHYPDCTGRGGGINRCDVASYDRFTHA